MWPLRLYRTSTGKKVVMALTGGGLVLFAFVHMLGNATALLGREAFLAYADRLHSLGPVIPLLEAGLLLLFFLHVFTGVVLYLENLRARPERYVACSGAGVSWPARLMPYTGAATLVFLIVHLANFHFAGGGKPAADLVRDLLSRPGFALFYMAAVAALGVHLWHGVWSLCQSLGISHRKYDRGIEKGAQGMAAIITAVFFLIPVLALCLRGFLQ
ncbi:MAG: succinate dehydrogenase cytochrome b subunit [Thermodesulfobacteriota bacterium]